MIAAMTEFWRCGRECAGVLHFVGLAADYEDRIPMTCDNFVDIKRLELDTYFKRYVRDAFSPVGLMLDWWDEYAPAGEPVRLDVAVINDTYRNWSGEIAVKIVRYKEVFSEESQSLTAPSLGKVNSQFDLRWPQNSGRYKIVASLQFEGETIESVRLITVSDPQLN
jgi:hypothetical protein